MANLNLSPNLFLEVNELKRFRDGIEKDGYKVFVKYLTKSFGIAQDSNNTFFKVSVESGSDNTIVINPGIAFDNDLNIIIIKEAKKIKLDYSTEKRWIVLSHDTTNEEIGTVKISKQGVLSGEGTEFLSVLRGQPNYPTKVRFNSKINTGDYEVVEVNSDSEAVISGDFTAENNLKYKVIGTFTPGFQPNDSDKLIYTYDSCKIDVIESESKPSLEDNQFILASIDYVNNTLSVTDERLNYLFNYEKSGNDSVVEISTNPLVALLKTEMINDRIIDIQFEWGYKVLKYELTNTSTNNIFNIISGESSYIGNEKIPDNIFAGWLLVNRKNMVSVKIDSNEGSYLYISKFNSSIVTGASDDFVIIPNYDDIEVEINVSGTNYDDNEVACFYKFSLVNLKTKIFIPVKYLDTKFGLKFRMINSLGTTNFQNFALTQFENILGEKETLGDSSFSINVPEPEEVKRNYS